MSELEIDQQSWDMAGMQGTGSKTLVRTEPLFVPERRRVKLAQVSSDTTPGRAIPGNQVASYNFATLSGVVLLGPILGMAQAAIDNFFETMRNKVKTTLRAGATATVAANPAVQLRVADASAFSAKSPLQRLWRDLTVAVRHVTLDTDGIYQMYGQERFGLQPLGAY